MGWATGCEQLFAAPLASTTGQGLGTVITGWWRPGFLYVKLCIVNRSYVPLAAQAWPRPVMAARRLQGELLDVGSSLLHPVILTLYMPLHSHRPLPLLSGYLPLVSSLLSI